MAESPQVIHASQLKIAKTGIRAFQKVGTFVKPTTRFIQRFGHHATRGIYQATTDQFRALLGGGEIPVDLPLDTGYVILTMGMDRILGLGFFHNQAIRSQLPRKELSSRVMI